MVNSEMGSDIPDDSIHQELIHVFYTEYTYLMEVYKEGLDEIHSENGDKEKAFKDIFRVYHTLKGDSAYFPEFTGFTKFVSKHCESIRNITEDQFRNQSILMQLNVNYSKLSSIFYAASHVGKPSLAHFQEFLRKFS